MTAEDLTLNIAVNLGRLARWVSEGKSARVSQFLNETQEYLLQLEKAPKSSRFEPTFKLFKNKFHELFKSKTFDDKWVEDVLTWANILTHRAKLA